MSGPEVEACKQRWTDSIEDKYTVMVPMHGHVNYTAFFDHYLSSPMVDRVVIVWANKGETPPDWSAFGSRVATVVQESDDLVTRARGRLPIDFSLNNRFRPCVEAARISTASDSRLIDCDA